MRVRSTCDDLLSTALILGMAGGFLRGLFRLVSLLAWLGWRYRSELAPFTLAVALWVVAGLLHSSPEAAFGVAVAAVAVTVGLWRWGGRIGIDTRAERLYATAVAGFSGTWATLATWLSPGHEPLPVILKLATLVLGVPWWTHRRRRARVRLQRGLEAWPDLADKVGLGGSHIQSAAQTDWGWTARIRLRQGQTVAEAINRLPALESGLGVRAGAVRIEPDPDRADRFDLTVLNADPHAEPLEWPGPAIESIVEPFELGLFEDGTPVTVQVAHRHVLVGGLMGSGKSGLLNLILAELSGCLDVVLWGIDLKSGMEILPWAGCLNRLATTPAEAETLLRDATKVLNARADSLAHAGQRFWHPATDSPALAIVIDEHAELADHAPGALVYVDSIARRGRAVAVTLISATQRPTQVAMGGGAIRSQMDIRVCFRVRERRDVDLILGQGSLAAGWHAETLDAPGKFLISAQEHPLPKRARAYWLSDQDVQITADFYAPDRPALDTLSAAAAETDTEPDSHTGLNGGRSLGSGCLASASPSRPPTRRICCGRPWPMPPRRG
jgi:S-DNA-T family DNA segregation ATPase FtsK/SpoIIIE